MKPSLAAACTGILLTPTSCERDGGTKAVVDADTNQPPAPLATDRLGALRMPSGASKPQSSFSGTWAAMKEVSHAQSDLFKKQGVWLNESGLNDHINTIFKSVSEEVLGHSYQPKDDRGRAFFSELNDAGYHLYISQMVVDDKVYLGATLFSLGEAKDSPELVEVKRILGMNASSAKMRALHPVAFTQHHDQLYGSVGFDGNIYVNVPLLLHDERADERSLPVFFRTLLANELGHLKLRNAVASGRTRQTDNQVEEAYSDYWSLVVTPPREILYSVLDVLSTTPQRYELSKQCAIAGVGEFGRANLAGFDPEMKGDSLERLVTYLNDTSNTTSLPKFKIALLEAYKGILVRRGNISPGLFDIGQ
jgi:hypothetical protein